jgi:hypothetical protein
MIVVVIIGIIVAFILSAAMDGIRRSEERATQALISKLETGLIDRLDALTSTRGDVNSTHAAIAGTWLSTTVYSASNRRAQVIAQIDRIKAELPDVFVPLFDPQARQYTDQNYLFNFAAMPLPPNLGTPISGLGVKYAQYLLPLGIGFYDNPSLSSYGGSPVGTVFPESTGIFGASYTAAGGLTQQLFAAGLALARQDPNFKGPDVQGSIGWDGADNPTPSGAADGLIDNLAEFGNVAQYMKQLLMNHTHKTARAEMLYAVLVNGLGPLGSVFSPDDFSDREVRDTDGDGLLEFVDAWGEPLQFYRWPIYYYGQQPFVYDPKQVTGIAFPNPDSQRGYLPYLTLVNNVLTPDLTRSRELDALDPSQLLLAPYWWSIQFNNGNPSLFPTNQYPLLGGGAALFQQFFYTLVDPNANSSIFGGPQFGAVWDRGGTGSPFFARRAYNSRFLILSGGSDKVAGVARVDTTYFGALQDYDAQLITGSPIPAQATTFTGNPSTDTPWLLIENQAGSVSPLRTDKQYLTPLSMTTAPTSGDAAHRIDKAIQDLGADDITNLNLQSPGGAIQ